MERRGHVRGFHGGERLAGERQAVLANERAAEAGAGHEHQDGNFFSPRAMPRLGHAAAMAVVAHRQRHRRDRLSPASAAL